MCVIHHQVNWKTDIFLHFPSVIDKLTLFHAQKCITLGNRTHWICGCVYLNTNSNLFSKTRGFFWSQKSHMDLLYFCHFTFLINIIYWIYIQSSSYINDYNKRNKQIYQIASNYSFKNIPPVHFQFLRDKSEINFHYKHFSNPQ